MMEKENWILRAAEDVVHVHAYGCMAAHMQGRVARVIGPVLEGLDVRLLEGLVDSFLVAGRSDNFIVDISSHATIVSLGPVARHAGQDKRR